MKIDSGATKGRFRATGRNISRWATAKGHNPGTVSQLIHGHISVPANLETTASGRIIADLKADNLLVEADEAINGEDAA